MTDPDNLRRQIERAKRFAASMTSETERIRFEGMASEFQRELQLVEAKHANLMMIGKGELEGSELNSSDQCSVLRKTI
jgi:hypothetical protein